MALTFKETEILTKDKINEGLLIMSYFNRFPLMIYDMKKNDNYKLLPDILRRVKQDQQLKSVSLYLIPMMLEMVKNLKI